MKHKKDRFDEDDEDTKEFVFSDTTSKTEPGMQKSEDALFEVAGATKKNESANEKNKNVAMATKEPSVIQSADKDGDQDALFEISESAKGNACDDETVDFSLEKESKKEDKQKEDVTADKKKTEELLGQLAAANDKYLRLMAEFDNFKRRSAKEYERMSEAANEKLMKDITEVRENFERAFKSNATGDKLLEGMKLIFAKLNTILQKHGLETYAEAGQKFDPELHDALMRMPHDKIEEGHVVQVHESGYKLKGNIIKHAKVVVSSGKPPKKETEDEAVIEIK
jgi:molecular chaperone GrpE